MKTPRAVAVLVTGMAVLASTGAMASPSLAPPPTGVPSRPLTFDTPLGPPPIQQAALTAPAPTRATVTLATGDQVTFDVTDGQQYVTEVLPSNDPARQTGSTTFTKFTWNGDAYAVPDAAIPYLATRTLDLRLFDVSYLVRAGLDDEHRTTVPVAVSGQGGVTPTLPAVHTGVAPGGGPSTTVDKAHAYEFGQLLASQWRASRAGHSAVPVGHLAGVTGVTLAPAASAPALPTLPPSPTVAGGTSSGGGTVRPSGAGLHYRTVTIDAIDRDGGPGAAIGWLVNVDDSRLGVYELGYPGSAEPSSFSVPDGTYSVVMTVVTPDQAEPVVAASLVVQPQVTVSSDTTITLDARTAKPYGVTLDPPVTTPATTDTLTFSRAPATGFPAAADGSGLAGIYALAAMHLRVFDRATKLYATPTAPVTRGKLDFNAFTELTGDRTLATGQPRYRLVFPNAGAVPSTMDHTVARSDLTEVHQHVHRNACGCDTGEVLFPHIYLPWSYDELGVDASVPAGAQTDYWYTSAPDLTVWQNYLYQDGGVSANQSHGPRRTISAGQRIDEDWNKEPLVPSPARSYRHEHLLDFGGANHIVTDPTETVCTACRQDGNAVLFLQDLADSDPTHGEGYLGDLGTLRFSRDGVLAVTSDGTTNGSITTWGRLLPLLPREATYRLEWRPANLQPATGESSDTVWTFRSGPDDPPVDTSAVDRCLPDPGRACSPLPLLFPSYDLALDDSSRAKAGAPFRLDFTVLGQAGAPAPQGVTATVAVSYDDGTTWTAAQPADAGDGGQLRTTITHPDLAATNGFVSLRVHAQDALGNAVDQTLIRAYGLTN